MIGRLQVVCTRETVWEPVGKGYPVAVFRNSFQRWGAEKKYFVSLQMTSPRYFPRNPMVMNKKRILIDLSILRHPYCGLGQIAFNYGRYYASLTEAPEGCDITLLVPHAFVGRFGDKVSYLPTRTLYRIFPSLMPSFDVWHSIHQFSPFRPAHPATKRILTIHDVNFMYEKSLAKQRKYRRRLQREVDSSSVLCFISRFSMSDALRCIEVKERPTHVIYNGIPPVTSGLQDPILALTHGSPFFLSIGVVNPKKNIHTLIPMMDRLPQYRLAIAGDLSDPYAQQIKADIYRHPNITLLGTVSDAQRRWLYAHCAALLFPSVAEGFGLPIIEAMQCGKPVFCSNLTSLPEIGGDYAHYFPDFNPDHMAELIASGMPQFTEEKAQAEKAYASTFSYQKHMEQYIKLYLEL